MRYSVFLSTFLITAQFAFSQANAGRDTILCSGASVEIGAMSEDPAFCYSWSSVPEDPAIADLKTAKITVSPAKTTTYTLTVVGQDFSSRSSDAVKVSIVDLTEVLSKEISEPDDFLIKPEDGGSFFNTGTFKFKPKTGPNHDTTVTLTWEVYDLDLGGVINQGTTLSEINYLFASTTEKGKVRIRFWVDNNNNSKPDDDECTIETEFEVKDINEQLISVSRAMTTSPMPDALVDAILSQGTDMIKIKDSKDDFRAAAELKRDGSVQTWSVSLATPDEVISINDFDSINLNVNARLKIVKRITWCGGPATAGFPFAGCAAVGQENSIIVVEGYGQDVWTHEIGHSVGLHHRPSTATGLPADVNNLMYPQALGTQYLLNKDECKAFEDY